MAIRESLIRKFSSRLGFFPHIRIVLEAICSSITTHHSPLHVKQLMFLQLRRSVVPIQAMVLQSSRLLHRFQGQSDLTFTLHRPQLPYVVRRSYYRISLMPGEPYISNCRCPFLSKYSIAEKSFLSRRIFLSNSRLPIEVSTYSRSRRRYRGY